MFELASSVRNKKKHRKTANPESVHRKAAGVAKDFTAFLSN